MTRYRRYRAPRDDGDALLEPARDQLHDLVFSNRRLRCDLLGRIELAGLPADRLASRARTELLDRVRSQPTLGHARADSPLVLSGHQPELFHPGVWFKNFVLARLARAVEGAGVHLLIDSDLCRATALRAPAGTRDEPRVATLPYDRPAAPVPYEERRVLDERLFGSLAERAAEAIRPWVADPMIGPLWREAERVASEGGLLRDALSEPRRRVEASWGLCNGELPLSAVCDAGAFRWFLVDLVRRAPELRAAHNGALADYRRAHRLRNAAQPIPDLAERDGWTEAPFWVWSASDPERRAVWTRAAQGGVELSDRAGWSVVLDRNADLAVEQLEAVRAEGVKLRSRALVTTLYCRLILADLFLHGIGGAKYDQVTDDLSERMFGAAPPPHATVTATLWLPRERGPRVDGDALRRRLRDMRYHPERFLENPDPAARAAVAEKAHWVKTPKARTAAAQRHQGIERANRALRQTIEPLRVAAQQELAVADRMRRAALVTDARDYAFCLFPQDDLRTRLTELSSL